MAVTWIRPLHIGKGRTIAAALGRSIDYVENPDDFLEKTLDK